MPMQFLLSFTKKTFAALREVKPVFLLAETDVNYPGGIEMVDLFDASYDWSGHHLLKDVVHGKKNVMVTISWNNSVSPDK